MSSTTDYPNLGAWARNEIPWTIDLDWIGSIGVHEMDDERRVELRITTHGYGGHYEAVDATILSKVSGPITKERFLFRDIWRRHEVEPTDHRNASTVGNFHVWENMRNGEATYCWYIVRPAHPERLAQAIERWIDLYR